MQVGLPQGRFRQQGSSSEINFRLLVNQPELRCSGSDARRQFIHTTTVTFGMGLAAQATSQTEKANESATTLVTLGLLTDVHYADKPSRGSRYYRESISKVREAAELFKQEQPAALVCMGDVIDAAPDLDVEAQHLKTITEVMDESGIPRHHVLGNHCVTNLTKEEFFKP